MNQDLVFISANSADFAHAEKVYDHLESRGVPVFLSSRSLPELGDSDYRKVIDEQLDRCTHMIVVTSSLERVESPWVEAEWGFFINAKRSRTKTGNIVTVTVGEVSPRELPPSLRYYEVLPLGAGALDRLLKYVTRPGDVAPVVDAGPAMFEPATPDRSGPTIKIFGVGGGGGAVVELMVGGSRQGIPTVLITTDGQVAAASNADVTLLIGADLTGGLGSGADPSRARQAAELDADRLAAELDGCDMVFLSAGLGGGTGTGVTPVLARLAREQGIVTVCFVSLPFRFEGPVRARQARNTLAELTSLCDVVIPIPCDEALQNLAADTPLPRAFERVAGMHEHWIQALGSLPQGNSMVNLDFADLQSAFRDAGLAAIGQGDGAGADRAAAAVTAAITTGYLSDLELKRAGSVFLLLEGGPDLGLHELAAGTEALFAACAADANIIFGHRLDESLGESVRAIVVATRFAD